MKHVFLFGIFGWFLSFTLVAQTGIWQWSVPVHNFSTHPKNPESRAYLWIPSQCEQVKAILVAQHNMEEISILEDEVFRQRMAELDVAQIWVCPSFNHGFDFTDGAWETGGHYGIAGAYSFYATKTMPLGDGGMVVSKNEDLLKWIEKYRNYGKEV